MKHVLEKGDSICEGIEAGGRETGSFGEIAKMFCEVGVLPGESGERFG